MNIIQQWIFSIIYLLTMFCYLGVETGNSHRNRMINKIILSSLFLFNSIINILCSLLSTDSLILISGIFFSWLGDVLLLKSVIKGGGSFMIANILYLVYLIRNFYSDNLWCFGIAAAIYITCIIIWIFMVKSGYLQLGEMKMFSAYILGVCLQGCCGAALLFTKAQISLKMIGVGLMLVMISDFFLASHYYHNKENKLVLRLNSSSYFIGMMIVSLMTFMINH